MAIPLSDYAKIIAQMPPHNQRGDLLELTEEDEEIPDRVWANSAGKKRREDSTPPVKEEKPKTEE